MTKIIINRIAAAFLTTIPILAWSHGTGVTGTHVLQWHNDTVARVVSPSYSWNNLGVTSIAASGGVTTVEGRTCMRAATLNVDVRDSYGFDLDETVNLTLVVDTESSAPGIVVNYDRSGGPGRIQRALETRALEERARNTTAVDRFVTLRIPLPKARFANRGDHSTDLMLTAAGSSSIPGQLSPTISVCDIQIERTFETPQVRYGRLNLTIEDTDGTPTAVRMGIYAADGRLPMPSTDAIAVRKFDDLTRTYLLQDSVVWPHKNRYVLYIDGGYQAQVPVGRYQLRATKGFEYRMLQQTIEVKANTTTTHTYRLERFVDMPARGWLSGDVHVHNLRRTANDNKALLAQTRAEDVHVANILEMGNVRQTYFPQDQWGRKGRYQQGLHTLVSGQEDPRTLTLGHTIHLNIERPVRFADDYLNYHRVFEAVAAQGGISGFAHAAGGLLGTIEGMTIQAAFGLLDFGEVMQSSEIGTDVWFALLNLGFRIAPAAGTDYPYLDNPGAVRGYVETGDAKSADAWFAGLEAGRTFVTNGPLLEMALNGVGIGSEVRVQAGDTLKFATSAALNPDIGTLVRLELIRHGEVIASESNRRGAGQLSLKHKAAAAESAWYVLRAVGQREGHAATITAATAPIYVVVDGQQRAWKRDAVPEIARRLIARLEDIKHRTLKDTTESEAWHSMPVWAEDFPRQLSSARARIDATQKKLQALADSANE